jgi:hypothetical protein
MLRCARSILNLLPPCAPLVRFFCMSFLRRTAEEGKIGDRRLFTRTACCDTEWLGTSNEPAFV